MRQSRGFEMAQQIHGDLEGCVLCMAASCSGNKGDGPK